MADRTITVSLDFTANTGQAENALRGLQTSLQNISSMSTLKAGEGVLTKDIAKASQAAMELRMHLQEALNPKTGKLDLSKFSSSLKASKQDIDYYRRTLSAIGPEGQQAFRQLANSIIASETPLKQTNVLVNKLWDGLKRTMGWQLSSSVIHGFMGAIQSAYHYAQDLNQSLNNIRIVTGASTDEMARFADKANKAAKALSSTTTDYTDAALIYYQQGIRDESEIAQRTDTTIKLANVSRQSAEEVSSQMTAIWNNFDDGSHSLEYYADVITKLGATTAASSSEIAGGMEKFAAVADTVGLSYEYAAASLATIVATTRQSEDTVGTGLRTIFSRLEGLKLGDTLEDGTDLNKYSQALATVGVNIKDTSGNLKKMDTILDETAAKWDTLDQAQKVAFATTVGGVRQYTNLIALLDNWKMMEENVATARGSEGTLQEQQDIYAEGWEAAQKRVRASAETLYSDLLDDKFFINLTNGFGKFLEILDTVIDDIGGLKTLLPGIILLMNGLFGEKIQAGIAQISYNIAGLSKKVRNARAAEDQALKEQTIKSLETMNQSNITGTAGSKESSYMAEVYKKITSIQQEMISKADTLTQREKQLYNLQLEVLGVRAKEAGEIGKEIDLINEKIKLEQQEAAEGAAMPKRVAAVVNYKKYQPVQKNGQIEDPAKNIEAVDEIFANPSGGISLAAQFLQNINPELDITTMKVRDIINEISQFSGKTDLLQGFSEYTQLSESWASATNNAEMFNNALTEIGINLDDTLSPISLENEQLEKLKEALNNVDTTDFTDDEKKALEEAKKATENFNKEADAAEKLAKSLKTVHEAENNRAKTTEKTKEEKREAILANSGKNKHKIEKVLDDTDKSSQEKDEAKRRGENVKNTPIPQVKPPDATPYEKFASTVTQVGSATMQAQMAISTFSNALDKLQDPNVSGMEKFLSILSAIGMGAPAALNAINTFSKLLGSTAIVQNLMNAAIARGIEAKGADAAIDRLRTALSKENLVAMTAEGNVLTAAAMKTKVLSMAKKGMTASAIAEALGFEGDAAATAADTIQKWLNVEATTAAKLATFGLVAAIGLLVIGGIALAAHLIKVSDASYQAEQALNSAKESASNLQDEANKAKDSFKNLKDGLDKLKNQETELKKLKTGTEEWNEALAETNEQVLELIKQFPELAQYVTNTGTKLSISAEGQEKVLKAQQETMQQATRRSLNAQKNVNNAEVDLQAANTRKKVQVTTGYDSQTGQELTRGLSEAELSKVMTAISETNGAALQNASTLSAATGIDINDTELINAILKNSDSLLELNTSMTTADATNQALDATIAASIVSESDLNSTIKAAYNIGEENNTTEAYQNEFNRAKKEIGSVSDMKVDGLFGSYATAKGEEIFAQYMAQIDPNIIKATNFSDNGIYYKTTDEKGNVDEGYRSYEDIIDALAELKMDKSVVEQAAENDFMANHPELAASRDAIMEGQNATQQQTIDSVLASADFSDPEAAIKSIQEQLSLVGIAVDPEALAAYAQQMNAINEAAISGKQAVEDAEVNFQEKEQAYGEAASMYDKGEISAEEYSKAQQAYIQAYNELQQAKENVLDQEIQALNLDNEQIEETTDYLMDNAEALDDVSDSLKDNKVAAKEVAKELARYGRAVEDVGKNYKDWKKVLTDKDLNQMPKVMKELSKSYGDLLDLDGSMLSEQFLSNSENLDLMNQAINGVEGAYDELLNRAQDDMLQLKVDPNAEADLYNAINNMSDNIRNSIKDIEVGAELNDEGFLQSLTDLVNAAGMTADEATEYLSSMGIDAEVVENTDTVQGETETKDIRAKIVSQGTLNVPVVASDGSVEDKSIPISGVDYETVSNGAEKEEKTVAAPSLKVKSAKKSSGGGFKASHGGSGSGGKGGGGGGGGGGSKKSKETPKADRGIRYHSVTRRQSNVSRKQDENNRRKDRAFGKAQIDLAKKDLELQQKKIILQEEYTKEISKNLKDDREEMKKQFEALKLPINFKFDEDGEIANYQEIMDALFEKEKALVEQYNSGGLDDEAFDEAKKKLDEAKEALGNYEETLELQKDELQTLAEYMEELSDKALELTQIKFELNMSIIEDQLEWLDYSLSKIEDDAYSAAKAIALMGEQTSQYLKQGDIARAAISEILGRHGINSIEELNGLSDSQIEALGFNKNEIEELKKYRSQLYESNQALLEMRRTITDKVLDTFDFFNEKVQKSYEEFGKYNDILESYNNIVDLLGTKTDAATRRLVKSIRDTQLKNLQNQSVSAKEIYEGALAHYDLAEKAYNDAVTKYGANSEEAQKMKEVLDQVGDERDEAYAEWLSALEASLEKAREIFEAEMEELQRDFEQALTGIYGTFDLFDAAYERAKDLRENYVPEYEKIYELNKLNRDIQKEIDSSNSLRDRKALRQLQEEINRKQEAGVQLSKYEVEEMRKKFELEQARMALEDARNNKSEVRLTRDANGNWGYVYTASEDKVADAEQKYEDALYQYQKLSDDYINELDEKIKNLGKDYQEQIASIWDAWKNKEITDEQRDEQLAKLDEWYNGEKAYIISQFEVVTGNLQGSLGLMKELFGQEGNLIDTFGETLIGTISGKGSIEEYFSTIDDSIVKYKDDVVKAADELQERNDTIMKQNEMTLDTIGKEVESIGSLSDEVKDKTKDLVDEFTKNFGDAMKALAEWDTTYGTIIGHALGENEKFITSLNTMFEGLASIASYEMKDLYEYIEYLSKKGANGETITKEDWDGLNALTEKYYTNYSKEKAASMATGGYTGEWGDEGKIAILHEKEYVLNADLTARFFDALKTFSLVDQFVNAENQIQQQKLQIQTLETLSNYIDQLADRMNTTTINPNDFSTSLFNSSNQQLEQNVHIEASFPNVTQSNEIEMAFDNLVNKASQYANRKDMSSMTFGDAYISKF